MAQTIFIDESGTLPDPKDKIIIMVAVGVGRPQILLEIVKKVRRQIKFYKKEKMISEIKFYQAGERTKTIYLKELAKKSIGIFALVVDKKGQKIADTPENFALLACTLIEECLLFYQGDVDCVVFDRHFFKKANQDEFNKFLFQLLGQKLKIMHLDSQENKAVNSADMVAGSLLWKYTNKDDVFYQFIKSKIISERVLSWRQAKRRFLAKTKNL